MFPSLSDMKRLVWDTLSLFCSNIINEQEKSFKNVTPRLNLKKLFMAVIDESSQ